ncbi:hypothetical protein BJF79_45015 [Actinomadura sp. CNU-125]|uniref:hypothetical protein n=1 Tax=Actinomadura sp. CNU-125 TaxID=1904961 RepID=UPI00095E4CA9|nr:hypothetical protein [Actinomadura sp. CNU-125]OLT24580.1 hypothetical protein BJF79_45015 [Actinomadura sp. CNU-125]
MLLSAAAWRIAAVDDARGQVLTAQFEQAVAVRELPAQPNHTATNLSLSADGERLVHIGAAPDRGAEFIDVPTLRERPIDLTGAPAETDPWAVSPDGRLVAFRPGGSTILWDLEKQRQVGEPVPASITRLPPATSASACTGRTARVPSRRACGTSGRARPCRACPAACRPRSAPTTGARRSSRTRPTWKSGTCGNTAG